MKTTLITILCLLLVLFLNPDTTSYSSNTKSLKAAQNSTSTTYAAITDLTFQVKAGKTYTVEGVVYTSVIPNGGVKITLDGTATATNFIITRLTLPVTALGSDIVNVATVDDGTSRVDVLHGSIVVNTGGTLGVQFAQVDADGGTTTISPGSYMKITPTSN